MLTAFPRFVAFTPARYRSRNALMNVITDKRSRNAGRTWPPPESLCCRGSSARSVSPRASKSQFAERAIGFREGSLSFNERLNKGEEKNCFFGAGTTGYFFFHHVGRKERKAGGRQSKSLKFFSKYGPSARQRPKCSYFRLGCWRERLLIFFAK